MANRSIKEDAFIFETVASNDFRVIQRPSIKKDQSQSSAFYNYRVNCFHFQNDQDFY